jgi:hypothetical protein
LRYLARCTHRVATFKRKDYRLDGRERYGVMTLDTHEFIRRFLMHLLPQGFYRIRYYGLLTSPTRAKNIAHIRDLLAVPLIPVDAIKAAKPEEPKAPAHACPCCGSRMRIIETFLPGQQPNASRSPQHFEALYVCTDPLMITSRVHINKLALDARLPSVCGFREFVICVSGDVFNAIVLGASLMPRDYAHLGADLVQMAHDATTYKTGPAKHCCAAHFSIRQMILCDALD